MEKNQTKTEFEQIKEIFIHCLKHWYVFIISFAICGILGGLYYIKATRVYNISSMVSLRHDESLIGTPISGGSSMLSAFGLGKGGTQNVEDETLKLGSMGYVRNVVKQNAWNFLYQEVKAGGLSKKTLYHQSPLLLKVDEAVSDTIFKVLAFNLKIQPEKVNAKVKLGFSTLAEVELTSLPDVIHTPFGDFTVEKSPYYNDYEYPMNLSVKYGSYDRWTQIYQKDIIVDFEKKTSDIIHLSMESDNTDFAKKFLSGIIDSYNKEYTNDKETVSTKTVSHLNQRIESTTERLNFVDQKILDFKNRYNLTDIEADVTYYLTQSAEIQASLLNAKTQLDLINIINDFVRSPENKYSLVPFSLSTADPSLATMITAYNEAIVKNSPSRDRTSTPLSSSIEDEIAMYRKNLLESLENIKKELQITTNNINRKEQDLARKIGNIPQIEKDYIELKREQELQQGVLIFLLEMREQADAKGISILPKLNIINEPYVMNKVVSPGLMKVALLILVFGGMVIPTCVIYLWPSVRTFIRKRND